MAEIDWKNRSFYICPWWRGTLRLFFLPKGREERGVGLSGLILANHLVISSTVFWTVGHSVTYCQNPGPKATRDFLFDIPLL